MAMDLSTSLNLQTASDADIVKALELYADNLELDGYGISADLMRVAADRIHALVSDLDAYDKLVTEQDVTQTLAEHQIKTLENALAARLV